MADNEIFSVAQMREYASDVLQEWLKGYTDSLSDGYQRRVEILGADDEWLYLRVTRQNMHGGYDYRDRRYRIRLDVEEVEDGAETGRPNGHRG